MPYRWPVLRALGTTIAMAAVVAGTAVARPQAASAADPVVETIVCDTYCDGRDAATATSDRLGGTADLRGRRFVAHVSDTDAMAWASVEGAVTGDEVWIDRSFDGGRSWDGRLGNATVPADAPAARTAMFNLDDPAGRGVGILRACGRVVDDGGIACTAWTRTTRNATDRRTAAATGLMMFYDPTTGLFDTTGWWQSANALTAIIDNVRVSGMQTYRYAISTTYERQLDAKLGQFRNEYVDDTGWWGLAWVAAYDLTGDRRYLATAVRDADFMHAYWDTRCGGGVYWKTDKRYKNAITNSLYIQLNAALARRVPTRDHTFRHRAKAGWTWFRRTKMINSASLVNDGISLTTCRTNGGTVWTYNQGVLVDALVELRRATGDHRLLRTARRVADAATGSVALHPGGILREPCEATDCGADGASFKGAYVRGIGALNRVTRGRYSAYLRRQADRAYADNRTSFDVYGLRWAGPLERTDAASQHSALDLLNAAP
jgi:predicted alpha-1,6-mannanase (GH76 family)